MTHGCAVTIITSFFFLAGCDSSELPVPGVAQLTWAVDEPTAMSRADFDQLMQENFQAIRLDASLYAIINMMGSIVS